MSKTKNNKTIIKESILELPIERVSQKVKDVFDSGNYCIDTHVHLFDIKCINKSYFILRVLKDLLGLKSTSETYSKLSVQKAYTEVDVYEDNWEDEFSETLEVESSKVVAPDTKGVIDLWHARKFLGFKTMESVYMHYINNFSLGKILNKEVIVTALMMDLEIGWNAKIKKGVFEQVDELKKLSNKFPVLPFLFCDPRRGNLIELFNYAFCGNNPFFGVKIYPALGYDPSDYRLWSIYEVCEKKRIPVLTHCGGDTISTARREIEIYEGEKRIDLKGKNRKEIAYELNNPERWKIVLEKFPNLKLNFAHFGGYETWNRPSPVDYKGQKRKETIFRFMRRYKNVFADFSYNLIEIDLSKNLREVLSTHDDILGKSLFGTDYWVVNKEDNLLKAQEEFLKELDRNAKGIQMSKIVAIDNPKRYLFG